MFDFLRISARSKKNGVLEVYPKFIIGRSNDLMIRGGDFYAVWDEENKLWTQDEQDCLQMIDREIDKYLEENRERYSNTSIQPMYMWDAESGMIDKWHKYCQKQCRDSFHMLDEKLIFSNTDIKKRDYASKRLPYPIEDGDISHYEELISTLYSPEERHKIEWSIGSIINGDSKKIQKFLVLYGSAGTGKSTILNIIQDMFEGYYSVFDAKALGSTSNSFALEAFKSNPLVAIQHDGDLSRIEDNTRLNSLVSHELMTVNEKFKSTYSNRFKAFLFMGTNKPVKITDAKSGLLRRLIDVSPTGNKVDGRRYKTLLKNISFELGAIAKHCLDIYEEDPGYYDDYVPVSMMGASNDFYNFVLDSFDIFKRENGTTLKAAWEMYKTYCDDARVSYPLSQRNFKEELKNYFENFKERATVDDDVRVRNYYEGFLQNKFDIVIYDAAKKPEPVTWLDLKEQHSKFDDLCADCPAQYGTKDETPSKAWDKVNTSLKDIDTKELHYVRVPENHIVIDFDIPGDDGKKSMERNIAEANKWPPTYAELSKGGGGVHLHYLYSGDVNKLARLFDEHIEVKVFTGKSSLRRRLSKCNSLDISKISSGLPFKEKEKKMVSQETIKSEKGLRNLIIRNLGKEIHPGTKPSVDFIKKILDDAYEQGLIYDVSDMRNAVIEFALSSTHHADECFKTVSQMKFKSKENTVSENIECYDDIMFFDVEVFPNLFVVVAKIAGEGRTVLKLINPSPAQIEELMKYKLVGFNNRRYDNHILYARLQGYSEEQLYKLSQDIIVKHKGFFGQAWNISYTDILDFSSKKQSLKKFEIDLGIHHQELGLRWDEPVPEELWPKVADYCINDVIATEAVWNARQSDWLARQILADVAGMTVNDTTNSLTTKIIVGDNRNPQKEFNYRDLGDVNNEDMYYILNENTENQFPYNSREIFKNELYSVFELETCHPLFPGYKYEGGISTYRGEVVGEGGYVYAEPGIYGDVALLDIASMHPHSLIAEDLFGPYTKNFKDLVDARIAIKHKEFDKAKKMLDGKLAPYLRDEDSAKALSNALKIAINSVYGLTKASFDHPLKDPRNIDNIVAKRGALFMINLKHEVQKRGFIVAHIKTDSIKIPNATPEIIQFVMDYGKEYGYTFEHEATYDRMCLVNDAVYIAKYKDGEWTATGTEFQVPYVFKSLFSREPIEFRDMCETKSVAEDELYLDMNEEMPDVEEYEKEFKKHESDYKKGLLSDTHFEKLCQELTPLIEDGHNYMFVGRVGSFCPVKEGCGGGRLVRMKDGKAYAVTGTKGYRWLEAETVKALGREGDIDESYYEKMVKDASDHIFEMCQDEEIANWFYSDEPYMSPPLSEGLLGHPVYLDKQF